MLGMSLRVERSSLQEVRDRLNKHKRKRDDVKHYGIILLIEHIKYVCKFNNR